MTPSPWWPLAGLLLSLGVRWLQEDPRVKAFQADRPLQANAAGAALAFALPAVATGGILADPSALGALGAGALGALGWVVARAWPVIEGIAGRVAQIQGHK